MSACGLCAALVLCLALIVGAGGCTRPQPPLVVGYLGGLTGRSADLGTAGRDGALLAVEQYNASLVPGRREAALAVADDSQDPEVARERFRSLVDSGALCVIGPMTSSIAVTLAPLAQESGVPLISPTTSTDDLTGKRDHFFRVYPDNSSAAAKLAEEVYDRMGRRSVAIVYDLRNAAHTNTWTENFSAEFKSRGGRIAVQAPFTSGEASSYPPAVRDLLRSDPDCVFVLAGSLDTAVLLTRLREAGWTGHVVSSEWSTSAMLIDRGGAAVEGVAFLTTFDADSRERDFLAFTDAFEKRFGSEPSFASLHAYDATRIALSILGKAPSRRGLSDALARGGTFDTVQGKVTIDAFGDVERQYFLMTVRDGALVDLE